ncbi:MAG: hypothetical protein ABL963_15070, partial [Longimicrobiales bacterium]
MNAHRIASVALAAALVAATGASVEAQLPPHLRDYPLTSFHKSGDLVAPYFDGFYDNGDGTVTFSFGFLNRNTEELVDIPLGENNRIEPAQFDGMQPTHFPVYDRGGLVGKRERGAFAVTVPANMAGTEVVWTLTHAGRTYSVPGRTGSIAYDMSTGPAAFGSLPPAIRFHSEGPESTNREGVTAARVSAKVGTPVTLSAMVQDRGDRAPYSAELEGKTVFPVNATWILHQGPAGARVQFSAETSKVESEGWGTAMTQATFTVPGDYVIRLRADNFGAP